MGLWRREKKNKLHACVEGKKGLGTGDGVQGLRKTEKTKGRRSVEQNKGKRKGGSCARDGLLVAQHKRLEVIARNKTSSRGGADLMKKASDRSKRECWSRSNDTSGGREKKNRRH